MNENQSLISDVSAMSAKVIVERCGANLSRKKREEMFLLVMETVRASIEAYVLMEGKTLREPSKN